MGCRYCGAIIPDSTGILQGTCATCQSAIAQSIQQENDCRDELEIYKKALRKACDDLSFWFREYNARRLSDQVKVTELTSDEIYKQFVGKASV